MQTLYKSFSVKADGVSDDGGTITGYASTFDREPDSYGDVVAPGAFSKSLERWRERDAYIPFLYGHRTDDPAYNIGRVTSAEEDERGLRFTAELDADSEKAQYVRKLFKEGRIFQFSFAFSVLDQMQIELEDGRKANELRELDIYEISAVQIPANQHAEVVEVKDGEVATCTMDAVCSLATSPLASIFSAQSDFAISSTPTTTAFPKGIGGITTTPSIFWYSPNGTAPVIGEGIKAGRRNSKADEDELGRILEHVAAINDIVNGLLGETDAPDEQEPEPEGDEPEVKAEEPDTANAEEPRGKSVDVEALLEQASNLLEKGDS